MTNRLQRRRPRFGSPKLPPEFWSSVERGPAVRIGDIRTPCWLWTRKLNEDGYPQPMSIATMRQSPFRHAYRALVGPIPNGLTLDHLCRVRRCVNPSHAEPVTGGENARRAKHAVTHCPAGHQYSGDNIIWIGGKDGHPQRRGCRTCYNDRSREYWHTTRKHREKVGRRARGYRGSFDEQSHCPSGEHPRTEENTYTTPQGTRSCRSCRVERSAAYNAVVRRVKLFSPAD